RCHPRGRTPNLHFRTREIASAVAQGQLAYYRALADDGVCRIIRDLADLRLSASEWQSSPETAPFGFLISMEGADPILSPAHIARWWADGLRAIGPAHYGPSAYAHGTGDTGGFTPMGHDLLRAMEEVGMILDLTHLCDDSFWDALSVFRGPVLASHNNCRA